MLCDSVHTMPRAGGSVETESRGAPGRAGGQRQAVSNDRGGGDGVHPGGDEEVLKVGRGAGRMTV